ncbi:MAG: lysylphosphatidylglycerol synthase transmembrane domain-containing protein [Candidatus Bathyarchaeia archaeon]
MNPIKLSGWKMAVIPILGICAFIAYLYLLRVDIPQIISIIQQANPRFYLLAALFVFLDVFFLSEAWRVLLRHLSVKLSVLRAYIYVWYSLFIDIIVPAESISGEFSRLYLVSRDYGNDVSGKVVASLVAHRLIGMTIGFLSLILGLSMLLSETQINSIIFNISLFLITATAILIVLLLLLCIKEQWTLRLIDLLLKAIEFVSKGRWKPTKIRDEAQKLANMFHSSILEFGRAPNVIVSALLLSSLSWFSYLATSYLVFLSLGFKVSWSVILVSQSIISAVKSIPLGIPFEVGLPEITMVTIYSVLGVPSGISATSTILNRVLTLWLRFFVGFFVQQFFELKQITTKLKTELDKPKSSKTY